MLPEPAAPRSIRVPRGLRQRPLIRRGTGVALPRATPRIVRNLKAERENPNLRVRPAAGDALASQLAGGAPEEKPDSEYDDAQQEHHRRNCQSSASGRSAIAGRGSRNRPVAGGAGLG